VPSEPLCCQALPGYLDEAFPEWLVAIWNVRGRNHTVAVKADMLVADVFVDEIFAGGADESDRDLLARWFETVEAAPGGPDRMLRLGHRGGRSHRGRWTTILGIRAKSSWHSPASPTGCPSTRRLSVGVEGRADSFALSVWPVHKAGEAGLIDAWLGEPLPVSDWREFADRSLVSFAPGTVCLAPSRARPGHRTRRTDPASGASGSATRASVQPGYPPGLRPPLLRSDFGAGLGRRVDR
jgi:hypothetical protein